MSTIAKQFLIYSFVGAIGTAFHYTVLIVLVEVLRRNEILSSACGFVVGAIINYALNYFLTFSSNEPHLSAAPKFFIAAALGLVLNTLIFAIFHQALSMHYLGAQVIATFGTLIVIFSLNRNWTFAQSGTDHEE